MYYQGARGRSMTAYPVLPNLNTLFLSKFANSHSWSQMCLFERINQAQCHPLLSREHIRPFFRQCINLLHFISAKTPVTSLNSINHLVDEVVKSRGWGVRGKNWIFKLVVKRNWANFNMQSVFRLTFLHRKPHSAYNTRFGHPNNTSCPANMWRFVK